MKKFITRDLKYVHYWKRELSMEELQAWLDKLVLYYRKHWYILLDEKLKRNGF